MFDSVLEDIENVFASSAWKSNNIDMYPTNYQGDIKNETEYCLVMVLPASSERYKYGGNKQLSGLVAVKIFTKAGEGQSRIMQISDTLDNYLQDKKLTNGTELSTSYVKIEGLDPSNKALYSASYFIPFKIYGE